MPLDTCVILLPPGAPEPDAPGTTACVWQCGPDQPVEQGSLEEAAGQARQARLRVEVVFSASEAVVDRISLTRRQAKHLRRILPYLLEERLLDPPEDLWFSHGKGSRGQFPVVACRRDRLEALRRFFEENGAMLQGVRVDAELLLEQAPLRMEYPGRDESLLLLDEHPLVAPRDQMGTVLEAAGHDPEMQPETVLDDQDRLFEALRTALARNRGINLLHSELRPRNLPSTGSSNDWKQQWKPVAGLAASILLVVWALLLVQQWQYRQAAEQTREQAEALYLELFPGDRVASLSRQFQARINELERGGGGGSGFLAILGPLGEALAGAPEQGVDIRRIHYEQREGHIQLDLGADNFDQLQQIRERIRDQGLNAEITEGRSRDDGVTARMRVG